MTNESVQPVETPAATSSANQFELNKGDNFIFAIDVSGSMQNNDTPKGMTRINFLKEKVIQFANEASKYDEDGIDVLTFGSKVTPFKGITAEKAKEVITPLTANEGSTDTAGVIQAAWELHQQGKYPQTVLFVATDGEPNDRKAVQDVITKITTEVKDEREFNISFLTVGKIDSNLAAFLTGLDDDLKGAKYDIVDVKALEDVDFEQAFMGALND